MRSRAHLGSHPIHPMLIPFPLAWMAGAIAMDLAGGGRRSWHQTARHMRVLGLGAAAVAAVPGIVDYLSVVPPRSEAARRAAIHGLANTGAVVIMAALAVTRRDDAPPSGAETAAQVATAALLGVAGYLGGDLVYRHRIGVDASPADTAADVRHIRTEAPEARHLQRD